MKGRRGYETKNESESNRRDYTEYKIDISINYGAYI